MSKKGDASYRLLSITTPDRPLSTPSSADLDPRAYAISRHPHLVTVCNVVAMTAPSTVTSPTPSSCSCRLSFA
ncbi:unnamed protein product [Tilletia controversa]|nr:unnamed protein product [Tilletia controversa]